ncbi:hypothetical protein IFM89_005122 [Coptis chinensis]|uniref:Uncharacterized protein n=1 Tax=Coptis chinensis TaxID=261450 RepID=A0A835IP27_9MAGN|nr:hypothetical protein IFM89_005122 [Coptis chinensis]
MASRSGKQSKLGQLLEAAKSGNLRQIKNCTPLLHATLEGHFSTVEYLIDNGADPAALNKHDITALHFATTEGLALTFTELLCSLD